MGMISRDFSLEQVFFKFSVFIFFIFKDILPYKGLIFSIFLHKDTTKPSG
jgi:hypothetical protein